MFTSRSGFVGYFQWWTIELLALALSLNLGSAWVLSASNLPVLLWVPWVSFPVCPSQLPQLLTLRHLTICFALPPVTTTYFWLADACRVSGCPSGSDLGMYGDFHASSDLWSLNTLCRLGSPGPRTLPAAQTWCDNSNSEEAMQLLQFV